MPDRNFDDLTTRFSRRIYGGLKGQIRLAVISRDLDRLLNHDRPFNVLDIGSGLSQTAIALATRGHRVSCNDLSENMLAEARRTAHANSRSEPDNFAHSIQWLHGPYQNLETNASQDLLLCHALLEWVDEPQQVFAFAARALKPGGLLSLSFYNPDGKIYRNLIRGNFDWLDTNESYQSDHGSLTPNSPCSLNDVENWLELYNFQPLSKSGIRVFHDYVVEKRGAHADPEQVLRMELEYSDKRPFLFLGRYLHVCARLKSQ